MILGRSSTIQGLSEHVLQFFALFFFSLETEGEKNPKRKPPSSGLAWQPEATVPGLLGMLCAIKS
jgi:hypothetical protein